ncbi:hypothetical protein Lalb_Chr21g0319081 [Lupinus albus]|uniref:Uncharacterized protein n=1 Tax=Lupinus albus TaxID=3870 RepID=A0A6A4NM19_LUPAL|nr:hypothetical protein Lalb_Chr21g0319081 [Lupinus albus]
MSPAHNPCSFICTELGFQFHLRRLNYLINLAPILSFFTYLLPFHILLFHHFLSSKFILFFIFTFYLSI